MATAKDLQIFIQHNGDEFSPDDKILIVFLGNNIHMTRDEAIELKKRLETAIDDTRPTPPSNDY